MQVLKTLKKVAAIGTGVAMLGATLTGAMALDLSEYPAPFVTAGVYDDSNVFVVGAAANAADSIGVTDVTLGLQQASKTCVAGGGTVSVTGGITEDIPLGMPIANANSTTLDVELEDDDIDTMFDGELTFQSANYDARDVLVLGQADKYSRVMTSLTSSEDDYQTDIVLETDTDAIKYYYVFDEIIQPNATTVADPLEIKFLGKTLKITNVDSSTADGSKFTAQVGTEYFMDVGDSVEVNGKTVTLDNVGEQGSVIVNVDGVKETIGSTSETVNGIEIKVDETFYETTKAQRSANLIIGEEAVETYKDTDAYVGEDEDDPNWIWNIGNLQDKLVTTTSTTGEYTGPYIGVENDFVWNSDDTNPAGVGECIDLPNNYLKICLDSLTVKDTDYKTYTFEINLDSDLSTADGGSTTAQSADAIYIHTDQTEGIVVKDVAWDIYASNITSDTKTDKVWVWKCANATNGDAGTLGIYYEDTNNKRQLAGCLSDASVNGDHLLEINYENTKSTDIPIEFWTLSAATTLNLVLNPYDSTELPEYDDKINMTWTHSSLAFTSLGASASSDESTELNWLGFGNTDIGTAPTLTNLGTKDEDHRTRYGIIIRDPKAHSSSDKVVLEIPNNQVMANIVIKGSAAVTAGGEETCTSADITAVTKLDTEIAGSEANYNLILVGGPCVNKAIAAVSGFGMAKCEDWTLKPGEGIIKLAANGNKFAMLVAGTTADDTRRTAKVLFNYKDYTLAGPEVTVKGTTINEATVE